MARRVVFQGDGSRGGKPMTTLSTDGLTDGPQKTRSAAREASNQRRDTIVAQNRRGGPAPRGASRGGRGTFNQRGGRGGPVSVREQRVAQRGRGRVRGGPVGRGGARNGAVRGGGRGSGKGASRGRGRGGRGGRGGKPRKPQTAEDLDKELEDIQKRKVQKLMKDDPEKYKALLDAELDQLSTEKAEAEEGKEESS